MNCALDYNDANWQVIDQNNWGWRGTGTTWLRQHIQIDKAHAGQPARLLLGTLFDADITYVNGQQVGRTYYQYPPRRYDIPEGLLREGDNVITIRFINKYGMAHFIPQKPYMLCFGADRQSQNPMPKDVIALSNKWLQHAGADMPSCPSGDVSLQNLPTTLYNAVLYPLAPYALNGIVWYQGESNTGNPAPYRDYLQKLMGSWRALWQDPALPFCIVQLANHDGRQQTGMPRPIVYETNPVNSNWARLREAQRLATIGDEHAETACLIDLGEVVLDHDGVRKLHDALLDPLQIVARACQHHEHEEIHHRADRGLGLADAHRLDKNHIIARRFAEQHRLAALSRDAAEHPPRRGRPDKYLRPSRQGSHTGLVAEYRAPRDGAGRIHREHRDMVPHVAEHIPERFDQRALACARYAGDSDPECLPRLREQSLENALGSRKMRGVVALDQRDRPREHDPVAVPDSLHVFVNRGLLPTLRLQRPAFDGRIHVADSRVGDAFDAAHYAACEFIVVFVGRPLRF